MDPSKAIPRMNMTAAGRPETMWRGGPNPQSHGAVSVVATVYPGVPQVACPPQNYNTTVSHSGAGSGLYGSSGPSAGVGSYQGPMSASPVNSNYMIDGGMYRNQQMQHHQQRYATPAGHPSNFGMNTTRSAAAVNAAAQAAAAAVATATATATAVAIDQTQFQNYPQDIHYENRNYQPASVGPHDHYLTTGPPLIPQDRPQQLPSSYVPVQTGRPMSTLPRYPGISSVRPSEPFYHQPYVNADTHTPTQGIMPGSAVPMSQRTVTMHQQQQQMMSGYGQQAYVARDQPPNFMMGDIRQQNYPGHMSTPNSICTPHRQVMNSAPMADNYGQHMDVRLPNFQIQANNNVYGTGSAAALPNNPTPPLTPATTSTLGGGRAGFASIGNECDDEESRLTLPLKNGMILAPFRLEHNSPVSQHSFVLDERTYQMLMTNTHMDLQLKCFHAEDKAMSNNWPHNANIQICVNGTPVVVQSVDRPLYVKLLCQKQQNTVQVAVRQCCCSHLFCLAIVNRLTVENVVREITRIRSIPAEQCMEKVRRFFDSGEAVEIRTNSGVDGNADIEQMSISMSLKCPITMKRIKLPARGRDCRHLQCFDLWAYLEINKDRTNWYCPICRGPAGIECLEVDQYVLLILSKLNGLETDEVTLDSSAVWKPITRHQTPLQFNDNKTGTSIKEENVSDDSCGNAKRLRLDPNSNQGVCGQSSFSGAFPASHFQSALGKHSNSGGGVVSPFHQANNSPLNTSPYGSVGTPVANFGSPPVPPPPRLVSRKTSRTGSAQSTSRDTTDPFNHMHMENGFAYGNGNTGQHTLGDINVSNTNKTADGATTSALGPDFPDFTFDDSDLLGSGDSTQTGGMLFNNPEELMKYLAEPGDYSGLGGSGTEQQQRIPTNPVTPMATYDDISARNSPNPTPSNFNCDTTSSDLSTMDDILSLLSK